MKYLAYFSFVLLILAVIAGCGQQKQKMEPSSSLTMENANFVANLSGINEVPDTVHTRATGQALFRFNLDTTKIHYKLSVTGLDSVLMAHVHLGLADENGDHIAWLYPDSGMAPKLIPGPENGVLAEGLITAKDLIGPMQGKTIEDLKGLMLKDSTYVQVHTSKYPEGEIRGQINPVR